MINKIADIFGLICIAIVYDYIGFQGTVLLVLVVFLFSLAGGKLSSFWVPVVISLLASSKFPESDFYFYMKQFKSIGYLGYSEFILVNIKSPLFYGIMLIQSLFLDSWRAASFLLIVLSNYLMYSVLMKISRNDLELLLFSLLLFGFYPIFDQSNHLMRQYMASAIMFALVYGKGREMLLTVSGFLTHLSFAVFFVKIISKRTLLYVLAMLPILLIPSVDKFLDLLIFSRNINIVEFKELNLMQILLVSPLLILPILNRNAAVFLLIVLCTMFIFRQNSEIVLRYWKFLVFFVPIVFIEFTRINRQLGNALILALIPIELAYFIFNILESPWTYTI